jgi:curli biogenesis system outer membrane secretion channel CsgG
MSRTLRCGWVAALIALLACGCATTGRIYVNPDADQGFYKKIAVLPFANVSGNSLAAPRVTRAFVTELIIADLYQVVEPELMQEPLSASGAEPDGQGRYPSEKVKEMATRLGAQGVVQGAVTEYEMQRRGDDDTPVLGFDVELLDVATGNVVWRFHWVGKGAGRLPVVGGGIRTLGQLTQHACQATVGDLKAKALR